MGLGFLCLLWVGMESGPCKIHYFFIWPKTSKEKHLAQVYKPELDLSFIFYFILFLLRRAWPIICQFKDGGNTMRDDGRPYVIGKAWLPCRGWLDFKVSLHNETTIICQFKENFLDCIYYKINHFNMKEKLKFYLS